MTESTSDTRQRLILAARDLFWSQGYHATGIAQILAKAGAKSGSLYYFFPTKEDLLLAVLEWYLDALESEVIQPVTSRIDDPIEQVFGILDGYRRMLIMTSYTQGCPIGNLALELVDSHNAARQRIAANFSGWLRAIQGCLERARGRLPGDVNPEQLATFVLVVMEGAVMLARSFRSMAPFDAAIDELRGHFERLLAAGSSWAAPSQSDSSSP
jgi:AcrR family transcriptional regulator